MLDITSSKLISQRGGRRSKFARRFAPPINKKEKRSQANEGQSAAEHPHFVAQKGLDLLCREKCYTHRQDGRQQSAGSRENQCGATVTVRLKILVHRDLQKCSKDIEQRDELKTHSQR